MKRKVGEVLEEINKCEKIEKQCENIMKELNDLPHDETKKTIIQLGVNQSFLSSVQLYMNQQKNSLLITLEKCEVDM